MSRIAARFKTLAAEGRGALIPYLEAFDPDFETSLALLKAMPAAGADLIEVGMPFSDPSADGPVIQLAARRGLKAGATLAGVLDLIADFRKDDQDTPVILMGYLNPVEAYGHARFCEDAAAAGVDGLILVDLPPEEADILEAPAQSAGLDIIRLVAPTTSDERLRYVLSHASGFVYYVSITGITGTRTASAEDLQAALLRIRAATDLPVAIGFGIRTPEQAATAAGIADGAVVASALLSTLADTLDTDGKATDQTLPRVLEQIKGLAAAVRAGEKKAG
ncbi:tryptophan synthase subunit alpha [Acetobacter persici]|uniref:Tryptophan synthase alpha chain n=1 Tax=Acetobacter persici TaxID=1076596 RepID=A0A1U9LDX9_9PROT|nr:tryptophan synthase subunit alpha [Acetobacter persici]AQT04641.1 tryptophan synthase subunit alpha [Acetobacter persici]MCG0996971.1 tryptophan synthase subunit alpha [Acetobacter persici]MCP9320469.1 tryptophan synthase subunit alpha [Acetobacter persici]GFE93202.1 tryptophan synthase alpha chain [Acetobacter persici]